MLIYIDMFNYRFFDYYVIYYQQYDQNWELLEDRVLNISVNKWQIQLDPGYFSFCFLVAGGL